MSRPASTASIRVRIARSETWRVRRVTWRWKRGREPQVWGGKCFMPVCSDVLAKAGASRTGWYVVRVRRLRPLGPRAKYVCVTFRTGIFHFTANVAGGRSLLVFPVAHAALVDAGWSGKRGPWYLTLRRR